MFRVGCIKHEIILAAIFVIKDTKLLSPSYADLVMNYISLPMFQYPKGLGNTVKELDIQHASCVVPKTKFSMLVGDVKQKLPTLCGGNLSHIVLFGIEVFSFLPYEKSF